MRIFGRKLRESQCYLRKSWIKSMEELSPEESLKSSEESPVDSLKKNLLTKFPKEFLEKFFRGVSERNPKNS